jgi:DNA-binding FadR family transcriptional regulator
VQQAPASPQALPDQARVADVVVKQIEAQIFSGELADGQPLPPERDLMRQFGTSRTVVREAIAKLAMRGLVESKPRFRPVVRSPGYEAALSAVDGVVTHLMKQKGGVKNMYDVRIFIEAALVRHAALKARKEDIAALRQAIERNREAVEDSVLFDETDVAFHAIFYRIPRNPVLPAVHKAFVLWLYDHWQAMKRSPEQNATYYFGHRTIFEAVVDRDADAAEQALISHLNASWETVRGTFETFV